MKKFVFVILHYLTIEDTISAVNSINKYCKNYNYEIVIIDNGSPNETGIKLKKKYGNNPLIHLILLNENLGFSKGNNKGIRYAKEKLNPDFIILMNNDTELLNNKFISQVEEEYKKSSFAVLGPKIKNLDNNYSCFDPTLPSIKDLYIEMLKLKLKSINLPSFILYNKLKKTRYNEQKEYINKKNENAVVHGCFLILSKNYLDNFDGLEEKTFLYGEEILLYLQIKKYNLLSVYNPDIIVFHKEASSSKKMYKTDKKRLKIKFKLMIHSKKIQIEEIRSMKNVDK